jgi:molybdopterin-guanine dinucleotide biosynthesis protein A
MGRDKASLPFQPGESLLQRAVSVLSTCVAAENIVCVAAAGQRLPELPTETQIVFDREPAGGPLMALATGLRALAGHGDAVFVCGCDSPLLMPRFVARMFELLGDAAMAAPHDGEHWHPLGGVYRTDVLSHVETLLHAGERSLHSLCNSCNSRRVSLEELREVDPKLLSLMSCNTPEQYAGALRAAGLTCSSTTE